MQMKRFLLLSIGVLVSGVLGLQLGQVTLAVSSSSDLLSSIFETAKLEESDSKDPKELNNLASNEEAPFENLYLFMFQNVTKGPSDAALEELQNHLKEKKKRDYSTEELYSIVVEGSLQPIMAKLQSVAAEVASDPSYLTETEETRVAKQEECGDFTDSNDFGASVEDFYTWYCTEYVVGDEITAEDSLSAIPQKNILEEYTYLVDLYQNELELQREYRKFSYESIADEMFFNGDLGDSANIDILHDLDLAHQVIFGTDITYPDRSGTEDVSLASEEDFLSELPDSPGLSKREDTLEQEAVVLETDSTVVLSSDDINPYTCFDDDSLHSALDEFYTTDTGETQLDLPESTIVYPSLTDDPAPNDDDADGPDADTPQESVDNALKSLDGFITELQGTTGDWTRSLPCGEVFCITVELVSDTEDPAVSHECSETDSSIFCHLAYINKRMGQTLDKSLVASKPSQNWFEDATCKDAGSGVNLDLNVYTIAMPIELDPGDDIDDVPSESVEVLKNTLVSIGALPESSTTQFEKTMADLACESIFNLTEAADTKITLDTAQGACIEAAENVQAQVDEAYLKMKFESAIGNGDTLYQQAAGELYSMLLIFRNIQDGLKKTYVEDAAPLSVLLKQPYCK